MGSIAGPQSTEAAAGPAASCAVPERQHGRARVGGACGGHARGRPTLHHLRGSDGYLDQRKFSRFAGVFLYNIHSHDIIGLEILYFIVFIYTINTVFVIFYMLSNRCCLKR